MTERKERRPDRMRFLAEWRNFKGYSQQELATKAGVSVSTISRTERDSRGEMQPTIARKIEEALGVEPYGLAEPSPDVAEYGIREAYAFEKAVWKLHEMDDATFAPFDGPNYDEPGENTGTFEENIIDWLMNKQGSDYEGGRPIKLPSAEDVRRAAGVLERIADAQEALGYDDWMWKRKQEEVERQRMAAS